jgi:hypothetical protein
MIHGNIPRTYNEGLCYRSHKESPTRVRPALKDQSSYVCTSDRVMTFAFSREDQCLRDSTRKDFKLYRQYYGVAPPDHECDIGVGDLGRFAPEGEFIKLGGMFESSGLAIAEKTYKERWWGVPRASVGSMVVSEEMVFDPFVSRTTEWTHVPDNRMKEYAPLNLLIKYQIPSSAKGRSKLLDV